MNNLSVKDAKKKVIEYLEKNHIGEKKVKLDFINQYE